MSVPCQRRGSSAAYAKVAAKMLRLICACLLVLRIDGSEWWTRNAGVDSSKSYFPSYLSTNSKYFNQDLNITGRLYLVNLPDDTRFWNFKGSGEPVDMCEPSTYPDITGAIVYCKLLLLKQKFFILNASDTQVYNNGGCRGSLVSWFEQIQQKGATAVMALGGPTNLPGWAACDRSLLTQRIVGDGAGHHYQRLRG